jgi:hypothetical protein
MLWPIFFCSQIETGNIPRLPDGFISGTDEINMLTLNLNPIAVSKLDQKFDPAIPISKVIRIYETFEVDSDSVEGVSLNTFVKVLRIIYPKKHPIHPEQTLNPLISFSDGVVRLDFRPRLSSDELSPVARREIGLIQRLMGE